MPNYIGSDYHLENLRLGGTKANKRRIEEAQKRKEKYNESPSSFCLQCGNPLPYEKRKGKFCDKSCAAKYNNKKRKHSKESKRKIGKSVSKSLKNSNKNKKTVYKEFIEKTCLRCGEIYKTRKKKQKYCSKKCARSANGSSKEARRKISQKMKERVKNGEHHSFPIRPFLSYPEKFFKKVLELNGFKGRFETNYKVKKRDLGIDCNANYFLDFYFPEYHTDLEIDGKQHEYEDRKKKDIERDYYLKKNRYKVYRIKWKYINNEKGKKYMKNEIEMFLKYIKDEKEKF